LINCFLKPTSKERLVPLFGHNNGALFATTYMPSSGDLTVEGDRSVVHGIEQVIQQSYSTMAIKKEVGRLTTQGINPSAQYESTPTKQPSPSSAGIISKSIRRITTARKQELTEDGTDKRVCGLASKQIHDGDVKVLTTSLEGDSPPSGQIRMLVLRDNMLTVKGVKTILRDYITAQEGGRQVEILDLGGNPIGPAGAMLFSRLLVDGGGGTCALKKLSLASTGLGAAGIMDVASWLGTATQLVELDLSGNGEFGVGAMEDGMTSISFRETKSAAAKRAARADDFSAAMEALVGAAEKHGHLVVKADDAVMTGLPRELVARFEQVNKSNMATSYLAGSSA
jgi:hypothetical protein